MKPTSPTVRTLEVFERQLDAWDIDLAEEQRAKLVAYARLLAGYEVANVVGERELDRLMLEHVLDSLGCLVKRDLRAAIEIADVGTGGGLPGIPLQIALPSARVTLIEATGKKVQFLDHAVAALDLKGIAVRHARVEELGKSSEERQRYAYAIARAVASLDVVLEYCAPLVRIDGYVVAMKAALSNQELDGGRRAGQELGIEIEDVITPPLVRGLRQRQRTLVVARKVAHTPGAYPRRPGMARKRPLGA